MLGLAFLGKLVSRGRFDWETVSSEVAFCLIGGLLGGIFIWLTALFLNRGRMIDKNRVD